MLSYMPRSANHHDDYQDLARPADLRANAAKSDGHFPSTEQRGGTAKEYRGGDEGTGSK
uniref:RING-type E3 ubiquitin transferase n=1 Tax=Parascaris univalens TaxID=6257 RepID=A0A915BFJ7_PARUN